MSHRFISSAFTKSTGSHSVQIPSKRSSAMNDYNGTSGSNLSTEIEMGYSRCSGSYAHSESTAQTSDASPSTSPTLEDVQTDSVNSPIARQDSHVLYDMNHNLKSSLTELLNSRAVREDDNMRTWAQTRLMEAERELRRQRRRKAAVPAIRVDLEDCRSATG